MATIILCDRCGEIISKHYGQHIYTVNVNSDHPISRIISTPDSNRVITNLEICGKCAEDIVGYATKKISRGVNKNEHTSKTR